MKKNLLLLIAVFLCAYSFGQGEIDAFRFSKNDLTGTARGIAMGGAFGALGGDVTGVAINPAGIGVYRTSELSTTLSLSSSNIETNWQNSINKQDKISFNVDNINYVGYYPTGNESMQSVNFGFSFNRLKNFNRNYSANGNEMPQSLTHYMASLATDNNVYWESMNNSNSSKNAFNGSAPWLSILGWQSYLINDIQDYEYKSLLGQREKVSSKLEVSEKGYVNSYDFTFGSNFSNSFYLGMSFSLTDIYYQMNSWYDESFNNGGGFYLDNYLQTEGSGYQVNLGAIWLPTDFLRLGVAYHSPTWYVMEDFYRATLNANVLGNGNDEPVRTPSNASTSYRLQTPYSWVFSVAGVLSTQAIISMDYEIKDYRSMNLEEPNGVNYVRDNQFIDEDFRIASTLRTGLEYRFTPQFSGRLGYVWVQSPYKKELKNNRPQDISLIGTIPHYTLDGDVNYFTAGIGYRFTPQFYLDFAFVHGSQKNDDLYFFPSVYEDEDGRISPKAASFNNKFNKGLLTLGYKF